MQPLNSRVLKIIGVLGAGNIGSSVIADLVLHDLRAVAVDVSEETLRAAADRVVQTVRSAALFDKKAPKLKRAEILERIHFTTRLADVAECDFIIENVPEKWTVKKTVYEELDLIAPAEVCFGVNTSCLSVTRIGALTRRPDKVVGMHFMNPVPRMPTVEVIRGHHTSDQTLAMVNKLFGQLRKTAIVVGDLPGFVSNRISHLFMNEAIFVLQDGLATAAEIDLIFKKCFGHKMGPLETADLIGLDTVMHSLDVLYDSFHDSKFRCSPLLRKMVDAGLCGRKSGQGFYAYSNSDYQPLKNPAYDME